MPDWKSVPDPVRADPSQGEVRAIFARTVRANLRSARAGGGLTHMVEGTQSGPFGAPPWPDVVTA